MKKKRATGMEYLETVLVQPIIFEATIDDEKVYRGGIAYLVDDGQDLDTEELNPKDFRTFAIPLDMAGDDKDQLIIDVVEVMCYMYDNVYGELMLVKDDGTLELIDISELMEDIDEDDESEQVKITHDAPTTLH